MHYGEKKNLYFFFQCVRVHMNTKLFFLVSFYIYLGKIEYYSATKTPQVSLLKKKRKKKEYLFLYRYKKTREVFELIVTFIKIN